MPPKNERELSLIVRVKDAAEKVLSRIGGVIHKLGGIIFRVGKIAATAFGGLILLATKVGKDFGYSIRSVGVVAGATTQELLQLEATARGIGATTAFSAKQASDAMYSLASAGLDVTQIMGSAEHAVKLAGATAGEMGQATKIMAATLRAFNIDASKSAHVSDVFAGAISKSMFTLESLSEAMKFAGTTGASLGWSLEETTAAVAQFANLGLEGTMAGTNLRRSMIALASPSEELRKKLTAIGTTWEKVNPATHNFAEIIDALKDTTLDTASAVDIFGQISGANIANIVDQARRGQLDIQGFTNELVNNVGKASEMYAQMMDTVQGQWAIMKSNIEEMLLTLFDFTKGITAQLFRDISTLLTKTTNFMKDNAVTIGNIMNAILNSMRAVSKAALFLWLSFKQAFHIPWVQDYIVEPLKQSVGWLKEMVSTAGDFYAQLGRDTEKYFDETIDDYKEQSQMIDRMFDSYTNGVDESIRKVLQLGQVQAELATTGGIPPPGVGVEPLVAGTPVTPTISQEDIDKAKAAFDRLKEIAFQAKLATLDPISRLNEEFAVKIAEFDILAQEAMAANLMSREEFLIQRNFLEMQYDQQLKDMQAQTWIDMLQVQDQTQQLMAQSIQTFATTVAGIFGQFMASIVMGQQQGGKDAVKALGAMLGQMAAMWGNYFILKGVAKIAEGIAEYNPVMITAGTKMIAGGAALVALGAILGAATGGGKAAAAGGGGGRGGGGMGRGPEPGGRFAGRDEKTFRGETRVIISGVTRDPGQEVTLTGEQLYGIVDAVNDNIHDGNVILDME